MAVAASQNDSFTMPCRQNNQRNPRSWNNGWWIIYGISSINKQFLLLRRAGPPGVYGITPTDGTADVFTIHTYENDQWCASWRNILAKTFE